MASLAEIKGNPAVWVLLGACLLPFAWPLVALLLPVAAFMLLSSKSASKDGAEAAPAPPAVLETAQPQQAEPSKAESASNAVHPTSPAAKRLPAEQPPSPQKPAAAGMSAKPAPPRPAASDSEQSEKIGAAPAAASAGGAAILAKLRAQREAKAAGRATAREVVVLYASQTGTAQEIAKGIQAEAQSQGLKSKVASMNEFGFENLGADKSPLVVMVASSTGDGDPPDNSAKFYMALRRKSHANALLQGVQFTVMGLGDSNYTRFCHVPRTLRKRFEELGATEFYPYGEADEVEGLETQVEKWLDGLWPALKQAAKTGGQVQGPGAAASTDAGELKGVPALPSCRVQLVWEDSSSKAAAVCQQEAAPPSQEDLACRDPSGMYSAEQPFWAAVSDARYLTTEQSEDRKVLHLELDVAGSGMQYHPGDSVGVLPENSDALVDGLIRRLGLEGDAVFAVAPADGADADGMALLPHLKCPCTVRAALKRGCDLTSVPRKSLLRLLAEHCSDAKEKHRLLLLCSRDSREAYNTEIMEGKPTLLDLLAQFPSCHPPLGALLDALPALPARMYSVACSPLALPDKVHVAFTVVHYESRYGQRDGVATTWLERLCEPVTAGRYAASAAGLRLPVFLRRGGDFKPPEDLEAPLVMIGPGTGVAPFRGFLQHRAAQLAQRGLAPERAGEAWLFFGCRREDQDYLYRKELQAFQEQGVLRKLFVAFSRAQARKIYVQHLMKDHAEELFDLIVNQEAFVFVCGDGANMAKDVHAALGEILEKGGDLSKGEAAEVLGEMAKRKRYVRDIWS